MKSIARWWPLIFLALIALTIALGYLAGFRTVGGGIERLHELTITDLPSGAEVYLDATPEGTATKGTLVVKALPGPHAVLANVDRYWPWVSVITMPAANLSLRALLIPRSTSITVLSGTTAKAAQDLLARYTLPSPTTPLKMGGGCVNVFVSNSRVLATFASTTPGCAAPPYLCTGSDCAPTIVFGTSDALAAVLSYPGRDDALIIAAGPSVRALALDPRQPRASGTILEGKQPRLAARQDGTIVGGDSGTFFSLGL